MSKVLECLGKKPLEDQIKKDEETAKQNVSNALFGTGFFEEVDTKGEVHLRARRACKHYPYEFLINNPANPKEWLTFKSKEEFPSEEMIVENTFTQREGEFGEWIAGKLNYNTLDAKLYHVKPENKRPGGPVMILKIQQSKMKADDQQTKAPEAKKPEVKAPQEQHATAY